MQTYVLDRKKFEAAVYKQLVAAGQFNSEEWFARYSCGKYKQAFIQKAWAKYEETGILPS